MPEGASTMSSIDVQVRRFLASSEPEILCLTGHWGVGKTYVWNKYLREARRESRIGLNKYSYVSLFGISTLEKLKYSAFENIVDAKVAAKNFNAANFSQDIDSTIKSLIGRLTPIAKSLPKIGSVSGVLTDALPGLLVRQSIVVVDDIERRSDSLKIKDIFGYINFLKEQRYCKVVFILNKDVLLGSELDDFQKYFEKSIDIHIDYRPSPAECAEIAFPQADAASIRLRSKCLMLGISNIRIMKRIEKIVRQISPELAHFHPGVLEQAIDTIVLFGFARYGEKSPSIEFLTKTRMESSYGSFSTKEMTEDERKWSDAIDRFGFAYADFFDTVLIEGMEVGYFDNVRLLKEAASTDRRIRHSERNSDFSGAWKAYHNRLDNNEEDIIGNMISALKAEAKEIDPVNLVGTVQLLRDLGRDRDATDIIRYYVDHHSDDPRAFDVEEIAFGHEILDEEILEAFSEKRGSYVDPRSPEDILDIISDGSSYSDHDVAVISRLSKDDIYRYLKRYNGLNLSSLLVMLRRISRDRSAPPTLAKNFDDAITAIAGESAINERRLRKFLSGTTA